jgi:tetratricopeptide (TPR) repeat protein
VSVRLAMLARDEEERMAGVAAACEGLYDDWVILLDDRDAGATEPAARAALAGEGVVVEHTFHNFAQARNLLFDVARDGLEPSDYLLLVDPDSPPTGVLPGLIHDWYECAWRSGQLEWRLPILVRAGLAARYVGAAHEVLVIDGPHTAAALAEELHVAVQPKPTSVERLETYLDLLLPDAASNPRSAYYLARTYRDLGRKGEALEAFLRCVQMPQWDEQVYCALLEAGSLASELDWEYAAVLVDRAHALRPPLTITTLRDRDRITTLEA